ncbi:MAG TPA: phosphoribosylamine--glycine ligase [Gemmatimonadaceae bacterium]|jgi:phosphoribosylamine---glycine ligase|nr:phosphoribosylamine--glycine ligase [Gemmatimonadaceae bacterium]
MKLLIVGGGGREHALAWKLCRDDPSLEIIAAPGNPGIASLGRCVPIGADKLKDLAAFAEEEYVDLTLVGPEAPLEAGIVNLFQSHGLPIFGPTREAARIETSKRFAKELMLRAGIPTARATQHSDAKEAKAALANFGTPVVIKASGLASGKGVIVAQSSAEAERAIDAMLGDRIFGAAGREILVEEYMDGEELSLFAITDGQQALPLLAAQDHKRLHEGDLGPNTGGMGAYAPTSVATPELVSQVMSEIIRPTLSAMRDAASPFKGLLYAGLMITEEGPKVVEFNCRFGDPETETILPLMDSSLLELIAAVAGGGSLSRARYPDWKPLASVTTVVASAGYPEKPQTGDVIQLPPPEEGVEVFHAGTSLRAGSNELVTSGGRVFAITATAPSLLEAAEMSRSHAEQIDFRGKQLRRDIGWRELSRSARAT